MDMLFSVRDVPAMPTLAMHEHCVVTDIPRSLGRIYPAVARWAGAHGVKLVGPAFARYSRVEAGACSFDAGFVVDRPATSDDPQIEAVPLGGCTAAFALHVGSYETLAETHAELQRWMAEHGWVPAGAPWESYLDGPETPTEAHRTEVYWPVRRG